MKYRNFNHWDNADSLRVFTQLIDEMLFEYSLDSYKPSSMNSSSLCKELLDVYQGVDDRTINKSNIKPVTSELCSALERDVVAKELIDIPLFKCIKIIKDEKLSKEERISTIKLVRDRISTDKYKKKSEEMIAIYVDSNDEDKIRSLTRNYITTLLNMGFHRSYIYHGNLKAFFHNKKVVSCDHIHSFFSIFSSDQKKYSVYLGINGVIPHLKEQMEALQVLLVDKGSSSLKDRERKQFENFSEVLVVKEILAFDEYSARQLAEDRVGLVLSIAGLFHHKSMVERSGQAIIFEIDRDGRECKRHVLGRPTNPMHKCIDAKPQKAAKQFEKFMYNFSLGSRDQFLKFFRAAQLHSNAISSESHESRFISLWTALESLVPSSEELNTPIVNQLISATTPFLSLDYLPRIIKRMVADLYNWDFKMTRSVLGNFDGVNYSERLVDFLVDDGFEENLKGFSKGKSDFFLLISRLRYLRSCVESPARVEKLLENHGQRVSWQIRRIYRVRNKIVHDGSRYPQIETLTENLHDYLDITMSYIVRLACDGRKTNSIEDVFQLMRILWANYKEGLSLYDGSWSGKADFLSHKYFVNWE